MAKPPKRFDLGSNSPDVGVPKIDVPKVVLPKVPGEDVARIGKLIGATRPPSLAMERVLKNLSLFGDLQKQFDAMHRSGIAATFADPERLGATSRAIEATRSIGALKTFDSSIGKFIEGLRLAQSGAFAPYSELTETIHRRSELLSGIVPTGQRLADLSASWRSIADLVGHSVVDRGSLSARIAERFAGLHPSVLLPDVPDASVVGFSRLVHLERASATADPFGDEVAEVYEAELGEPVDYDDTDTDEDRRERFDRAGFNPQLTAFAPDRQVVVVSAAGFGFEPLAMLAPGTDDLDGSATYDENAARIVWRVEREVRQFVERELERLAGPKWIKQRVPGDMLKRWKDRREVALSHGEPDCPLIFYADFVDLSDLIRQRNNWDEAFERVFKHKVEVEVSFRRMHPTRIAIAHTRPVLAEGVALLAAEAARMLQMIGRAS